MLREFLVTTERTGLVGAGQAVAKISTWQPAPIGRGAGLRARREPNAPRPREEVALVTISSDRKTNSVLIVDGDAELRWVLRLLFEFEDFEVAGEASSGAEGIALALKLKPELVVLDQAMPGMTGDKSARLLRELVPEARIVAFSAVLKEKPIWADAFLNKDRISEIAPLLVSLVTASASE